MLEQPTRVAVVLFNLGGPGQHEAVRPFLTNLFNDPAILRVPFFLRRFLAWLIARSRINPASENYALLGGLSPLLELTRAQATALEANLPGVTFRCFIAMRYWYPFSDTAAQAVRAWRPDEVVLLPLYPQNSTTTTASSLRVWREAAANVGLVASTRTICCYPTDQSYASVLATLAKSAYMEARLKLSPAVKLRVLFSAHGLPETIIRAGDPYQWQVSQTVAAVLAIWGNSDLDWVICYQSRATPQKWIGPSTDSEVERAAHDKVAVLVVPVAFVSEHSETIVELDVEYRTLANRLGVPGYFRVPAPGSNPTFIQGLAGLISDIRREGVGLHGPHGFRICPAEHTGCPCRQVEAA